MEYAGWSPYEGYPHTPDFHFAYSSYFLCFVMSNSLEMKDPTPLPYRQNEVRRALEIHVPTVVLLDWNMPDGRGDSLCQPVLRFFLL